MLALFLLLGACANTENTPEVTATPAPSPTATPEQEIWQGEENERVARMQQRLIDLNYLDLSTPTSFYGEQTEDAVKAFQEQNGLLVTGFASQTTLSVLYSADAIACPLPLAGLIIGVDPGHQLHGNYDTEPVSPGSSTLKAKVSSGTQGRFTRVTEYQVNLDVGLLLKTLLEKQGATVIMTRETNDVNISNVARAKIFNEAKVDLGIRLHCNGSNDATIHGAFMCVPKTNHYLSDCNTAAQTIIDAFCAKTGAQNRGLSVRGDLSGFNWCDRCVVLIEMGFMTNEAEDNLLASKDYQQKMAQGLLNGIMKYFEKKNGK